jgi:hypothetical protein
VALAAVIAVVPQLTDCHPQGIPMRCHWTAQASLAAAILLAVVGGNMGLGRSRTSRRRLAATAAALGVLAILLPTRLIQVCPSPLMHCNMIMKPVLVLCGMIVSAIGTAIVIMPGRIEKSA